MHRSYIRFCAAAGSVDFSLATILQYLYRTHTSIHVYSVTESKAQEPLQLRDADRNNSEYFRDAQYILIEMDMSDGFRL